MDKKNRAVVVYDLLFERYGDLNWWPAETPYEVIVGAVLTQNTTWTNVEKAIAGFNGDLHPELILNTDIDALKEIIKPAGFANQKSAYLQAVTRWFMRYNFEVEAVSSEPLEKMRTELLAVQGVGQETADAILLYAFGFPTFVIDKYTMRLCERLPLEAGKTYGQVKNFFESNLTESVPLYNNYHALIVMQCKDHCRKSPNCEDCPLMDMCQF